MVKKVLLFSTLLSIQFQTQSFWWFSKKAAITIEQGDITQAQTECIVNAANDLLLNGQGVCGAIFKAAGSKALQQACNKFPINDNLVRCPTGEARITGSFNLKSKGITHIIHAVGPDCRIITDEDQQNTLLKQTYQNSLNLATQHKIKSISFPFISSAIYAFPKDRAARIALETVREYVKKNKTSLKVINFVLFSQDDFDLFTKINKELAQADQFKFVMFIRNL